MSVVEIAMQAPRDAITPNLDRLAAKRSQTSVPTGWVYDHIFSNGSTQGTILMVLGNPPAGSIWAMVKGSHCDDMTYDAGAYAGQAAAINSAYGCGTYSTGWHSMSGSSYLTSLRKRSYTHQVRVYSAAAKPQFLVGFFADCGGGNSSPYLYWYTTKMFFNGCTNKVINSTP